MANFTITMPTTDAAYVDVQVFGPEASFGVKGLGAGDTVTVNRLFGPNVPDPVVQDGVNLAATENDNNISLDTTGKFRLIKDETASAIQVNFVGHIELLGEG